MAGFIPGITTHYSEMKLGSHLSGAQLLGVFQVSILHNVVHLLFGAAGLVLARTPLAARKLSALRRDRLLGAGMITLSFLLGRGPGWRRTVEEGKASIKVSSLEPRGPGRSGAGRPTRASRWLSGSRVAGSRDGRRYRPR